MAKAKQNNSLPHNVEAEEAVLGCILINPETYVEAAAHLKASHFYIHRHQWIWEAFERLNEKKLAIDIITVTNELETHGKLKEVGGAAYLTRLINSVPTSLHAESYARTIANDAVRRRLLEGAAEIARLAYESPDHNIEQLIGEAQSILWKISRNSLPSDPKHIEAVARRYYDYVLELAKDGSKLHGTPTGFIDLDRLLGGLRRGKLAVIAGRPGTGKTTLMLSIARNAIGLGKRVAFFSLEMEDLELMERMAAQHGELNATALHHGALEGDEWKKLSDALDDLAGTDMVFEDAAILTPAVLRAKCAKLHDEHPLDLIIVDYLQLMKGDGKFSSRVEEVSYISRELKLMAKELGVPVLAGAQLNRNVEHRQDKRPMLSDLRESGSIEQDSDKVMFIHPNDSHPSGALTEIIVEKNRQGKTGAVPLVFDKDLTLFRSAAYVDAFSEEM